MSEALDRRFMAAAIRLGASALGTTWPNPAVGAILVKDGHVVGRGRTARGGRPHAETEALAMAGAKASGATFYVSLEPCSHHGKTPPCADAISAADVGQVITPIADPNPDVAGRGLKHLEEEGVAATNGVMAAAARAAHRGHISRVERARPHVILKLAVSADDAIGREGEGQVAVTGAVARRHVQALRTRFDAILVGSGTVAADDPSLTCRLPGLEDRSPVRVVLDSDGRLQADRKIFDGAAPTWLFTADHAAEGAVPLPSGEGKLRRFAVPRVSGGLDLAAVLKRLADEGITRLLVEGGARVARGFLEAGLVDMVMLFRGPETLGGEVVPALAGLPLAAIERAQAFGAIVRRRFGADRMTLYERAG